MIEGQLDQLSEQSVQFRIVSISAVYPTRSWFSLSWEIFLPSLKNPFSFLMYIARGKEAEGVWEQVLRGIFGPRTDEVTGGMEEIA